MYSIKISLTFIFIFIKENVRLELLFFKWDIYLQRLIFGVIPTKDKRFKSLSPRRVPNATLAWAKLSPSVLCA